MNGAEVKLAPHHLMGSAGCEWERQDTEGQVAMAWVENGHWGNTPVNVSGTK